MRKHRRMFPHARQTTAHAICMIAAKPEESRSFDKVLGARYPSSPTATGTVFQLGKRQGKAITLFSTACSAMGNVHAATKTAQVIATHFPSTVFFVGTTGSLRPDQLRLGDVIIPSSAFYRIYDKIVESGEADYNNHADKDFKEHFFETCALLPMMRTQDLERARALRTVNFPALEASLNDGLLPSAPEGQLARKPKIVDDLLIATCGMLVNSETYRKFFTSKVDRKVAAIDMESYGFFRVLAELQRAGSSIEGIMVRGVSDYAGKKEAAERGTTDWKQIANENAAIVVVEIIESILKTFR